MGGSYPTASKQRSETKLTFPLVHLFIVMEFGDQDFALNSCQKNGRKGTLLVFVVVERENTTKRLSVLIDSRSFLVIPIDI